MKKLLLSSAIIAFSAINIKAQVKPVDPSTFSGHYFTEVKMEIDGKKKKDEVDFAFDASTGKLIGTVKGYEDKSEKIVFRPEAPYKTWAENTKIWILRNNNGNRMDYGKDMFDENNFSAIAFIEEGVIVLFKYYGGKDKSVRMFDVDMDVAKVRIMAKDKSKLGMDKLEAAKKAEEMINAAGGVQMKKALDDQKKADFAVPKETLSKTDKQLKADIKEFFDNVGMPADDQTDYVCSYSSGNDWSIITNQTTGAILERQIAIEMVRKGKVSGKCRRYMYLIGEQYNGTGYGKPTFRKNWGMVECNCSDAEKNK